MNQWLVIEESICVEHRDDAKAPGVVVLAPADDGDGWVARLRGLDPDYDFARVFLVESEITRGEPGGLVKKHYELRRDGLYQVHSPKLEPVREFVFLRRLGARLEEIDRDTAQAMLRGESRYTYMDVEAACGAERWRDALVAAMHLERAEDRQRAMVEIQSAREARAPAGWNRLVGTERQVRWAGVIREHTARALSDLFDAFFVEIEDPDRLRQPQLERFTRLTAANTRLRQECDAQYWISQRHELELGSEPMLEALLVGESQRHEDLGPVRLEELGDRNSE